MLHSLIKWIFAEYLLCVRYIPVMYREAAWNKTKLLFLPSSEETENTQYVHSKIVMMVLEKLKY